MKLLEGGNMWRALVVRRIDFFVVLAAMVRVNNKEVSRIDRRMIEVEGTLHAEA